MANEITIDVIFGAQAAIKNIQKLEKQTKSFEKKAVKSFNGATKAFDVFKGALGAAAVISVFNKLKNVAAGAMGEIASKSIALEQMATKFEVLTGSAAASKKILEDLQNFAATTPFQLPGIGEAASQLLAFGKSQKEIIPTLKQIGDVAAGSGSDLKEIALIYGQVGAAGKLTGERLLQLQERAIPIGPAIAKTMGVAESSVKDLISAGKVTQDIFEEAFASMSSSSGLFYEGMVKQSKTLGGVMSTLGDNMDLVFTSIGTSLLPIAKIIGVEVIGQLQNLIGTIKMNQQAITAFVQGAALNMIDTFRFLAFYAGTLGGAMKVVANVLTTVLAGAVRAVLIPLEILLDGIKGIANSFGVSTEKIDAALKTIKETNADMRDQILTDADDIENALEGKGNSAFEAADKIEDASIRIKTSLNEEAFAHKNAATAAQEAALLKIEAKKLEMEELAILRDAEADFDAMKKEEDAIIEGDEKEESLEALSDHLGREEAMREKAEITQLTREGKLDEARKKKTKLAEKNRKAGIFSAKKWDDKNDKEKLASVKQQLDTVATLQSSGNATLFAIGKAAALANHTIATIQAVDNALKTGPPPVNFVLAGLVGTAMVIQGAKLASAKAPGKQDGGIVGGAPSISDNVLQPLAGGEMILNKPQQTELFSNIASGNLGGGGGDISISISSLTGDIPQESLDNLITQIKDAQEFNNGARFAS